MAILMLLSSLKSYDTVSQLFYLESEVQNATLMSLSSLKSYATVSLKIPAVLPVV